LVECCWWEAAGCQTAACQLGCAACPHAHDGRMRRPVQCRESKLASWHASRTRRHAWPHAQRRALNALHQRAVPTTSRALCRAVRSFLCASRQQTSALRSPASSSALDAAQAASVSAARRRSFSTRVAAPPLRSRAHALFSDLIAVSSASSSCFTARRASMASRRVPATIWDALDASVRSVGTQLAPGSLRARSI
jgi:hypothetical protein